MHARNHLLQVPIAPLPDIEHLLTGVVGEDIGLVIFQSPQDVVDGGFRAGLVHWKILRHIGIDRARVGGVDRNSPRLEFDANALGQRKQRRFGCAKELWGRTYVRL